MTQINTIVAKIKKIALTGEYGSPRRGEFMNKVLQNYMKNISSPVKAAAFAKFYKDYNNKAVSKCNPSYSTKSKIKPHEPDFKAIAMAAKKAKANYYNQMKTNPSLKQKLK
tara:strand:+ start:10306 stop:10638 length:333 start_codon:yes stop_codon:yes gene_type:complete